jgi:hypothetical protein
MMRDMVRGCTARRGPALGAELPHSPMRPVMHRAIDVVSEESDPATSARLVGRSSAHNNGVMTGESVPSANDDPVAVLRQWEADGGQWRVVERGPDGITCALYQGPEEIARFTSANPTLAAYVYGRNQSS